MGKEITKLCGHASNGLCSDHFTEVDNFGIGSNNRGPTYEKIFFAF